MSIELHNEALNAYREAVDGLYGPGVGARPARAERAARPREDAAQVKAVIEASRGLTRTTASLLQDDSPLVRESGEARLAALAAHDIALAVDVARLAPDARAAVAAAEPTEPAFPAIMRELAFVLDADPADGVPPSRGVWAGRAQLSGGVADPKEALRTGLPAAIARVRDDATELVLGGLGELLTDALSAALGTLATGVLRRLPDQVKRWYRWALQLVKEAVNKLRKLFGRTFAPAVESLSEWVQEWWDKLAPEALADRVYGVPELTAEVVALVDEADGEKDWGQVGEEIQAVVERYATQKKIALVLFKALGLARNWILRALAPGVGEVVVDAVLVLGAAYGLFAGGDYLDWHRTKTEGAFDFVRGVRRTAEAGLA